MLLKLLNRFMLGKQQTINVYNPPPRAKLLFYKSDKQHVVQPIKPQRPAVI